MGTQTYCPKYNMEKTKFKLMVEPVTKSNWKMFETLFGEKGACCNCWCMYYRLSKSDFSAGQIENGNKKAMKNLIWSDRPVGLLGLLDGHPVAWCALAPRKDFLKLEKSRVHKPIDDQEVWSIPCIFIDKKFRRSGISELLIKEAVSYAKVNNIKIIEAYPAIPIKDKIPDSFAWFGLYQSFERAGFGIVDRTSKNRPMVRYYVDEQ
jgi:GNAT superfamily N-acetyltransferase